MKNTTVWIFFYLFFFAKNLQNWCFECTFIDFLNFFCQKVFFVGEWREKCIHLPWVFVNVKKFAIFLPENGRWWSPLGSCTNQTSSSTFDHTSILRLQSKLVPQNYKKWLLEVKRYDLSFCRLLYVARTLFLTEEAWSHGGLW